MLRLHSYAYERPESLEEALRIIAANPGSAMSIAGGTDLMPNMKHQLFTPKRLVALRQIPELHGIHVENNELVIGAAETLTTLSRHPLVRKHAPSLARAAGLVAGPQLRNMGTIGGNLCLDTRCTYYNQTYFWREALGFCLKKDGDVCHVTKVGKKCVAAHSADTPPALMTIGGVVDLASVEGERSLPVSEFFVADGMENTLRGWNELVTRVRVPLPKPGTRATYVKLRQRASIDFPLLSIAVAGDFEGDVVQDLRIVVSALGSRPRQLSGLEKIVAGQRLTDEVVDAVAERAFAQCHPLENIIVDPEWRRAMVPVYVKRALAELRGASQEAAA
ncbi:MAG: 4-hydroxybenzoyl-CoA reductase subunit beta [Candidatus Cloacimonetes bacterium]|nr:4-hydroxybenzoyl-CoA reductase subunit beta [Candidatus Cloacimonadota bacterium]